MKLLIVEDYLLVAWALRLLVTELGHTVVGIATFPDKAIRIAQEAEPDLALVDIRLENNTSGVDAARGIYETCGVRSLYVTAYRNDAKRIQAALGCLLKPYSQADIRLSLEAVERILGGQEPGKTPAPLELFRENFPGVREASD